MTNVYFARPFSEYSPESVKAYYNDILESIQRLTPQDPLINAIVPLSTYEAGSIFNKIGNQPGSTPELSDKAILEKDLFLIRESDIVVIDLTFEGSAIGTTVEMAYAHAMKKHIVLLYEKDRPAHIFHTGLAHVKYPVQKNKTGNIDYMDPVLKYILMLAQVTN